jgi:apolipoprotein D and lipocalin family protein
MRDLDADILAAERRVVEADERLRAQVHALTQRARRPVAPRGSMMAAVAIGAIGLLGWALTRRRAPRPAQPAMPRHGVPHREARAPTTLPWTQLLALAWPLVPATWRARVSPATAAGLASLALPLLGRVLGADEHPPLTTMAYVDLRRYGGNWFEVARLPAPFEGKCSGVPTATYGVQRGNVSVVNRCADERGRVRTARGIAKVVPGSGNARLRVSLWPAGLRWLPIAWADYWILHVDPDYGAALVGHPNRRFLWILSRRPRLSDARLQALIGMAVERGYTVDRLKFNLDA